MIDGEWLFTGMGKISIDWIPAHPSYGSVSMLRYWKKIAESLQAGDPYRIASVLEDHFHSEDLQSANRWYRMGMRKAGYPLEIRRKLQGELVHVLDHSWADMLDHVPRAMKKVVTVHDLIPLRFPGELTTAQVNRFRRTVEHLRHADRIICVSEYTKSEVHELLGIPEQRMVVVPNGVEPFEVSAAFDASFLNRFEEASAGRHRQWRESGVLYLGCIGNTSERKNLSILPDALRRAVGNGMRIVLVRAGSALPTALAGELEQALGQGNFIELGALPDEELGAFYRAMDGVVVPSTYEGFGLPVLEAMAVGTPVISSSATSLPEVGGDAVLYFSPNAPAELAQRLEQWGCETVRRELSSKGKNRAAGFSWRNHLLGLYAVYDELLGESSVDAFKGEQQSAPKIAAVFASYNRRETALECVRRLQGQTRPPDWVVVGENASTDGTPEALAALHWDALEVVHVGDNLGNAGGVRMAMERAFELGADAVWILDDDSWPEREALEALLEGGYQSRLVRHSVQIDPRNGRYSWPLPVKMKRSQWGIIQHPDQWPGGDRVQSRVAWTGALVPKEIRQAVGPVMGELFIRGEDEEYPRRIAAAGFAFEAVRGSVLSHPSANRLICWRLGQRRFWFEPGLVDWKFYYEARNTIWLKLHEGACAKAIGLILLYGLSILTHGPRTWKQYAAWWEAVRDAWLGQLGRRAN